MKRRLNLVLVLMLAVACAAAQTDFTAFDQSITTLMAKHHIPGATIAVARNGKLVIARAYGLADRERNIPTQPDSLFRIASISKTLTSTAILKLIDEGRLTLDTKVFPLLDQFHPPKGKQPDPRLADITIRNLLQHTGGWDLNVDDPMEMAADASRALNVPAPVRPDDLIHYVVGQPLNFDPGSRFAYSNFGYEVLGRVVEKITHMPYEDYVKLAILVPIGVHSTRQGETMLSQRADGEVLYYDFPGAPLVWTRVRGGPPVVARPYAFPIREFDSAGGWVSSVIDLTRFALAMDEQSGHELILQPATLRQARADRIASWPVPTGKRYYALGWVIDVAPDGAETWWHNGGLPGTSSIVAHRPDGIVYAVLFNTNPWNAIYGDMMSSGDAHQAITAAIDSIHDWPDVDLFDIYR